MNVYEALRKVMEELGPVGKTRTNEAQGYQYRGIDDLYNEISRLHAKYGVTTIPRVLSKKTEKHEGRNGRLAFYTEIRVLYYIYGPDGSCVKAVVVADGLDSSDKSVYKALSGAHKYLLIQMYCVPTGEGMDVERDHIEVESPTKYDIVRKAPRQKAEHPAEPEKPKENHIDPVGKDPTAISREASEAIQTLREAKTVEEAEKSFYAAVKSLKMPKDKVSVYNEFEQVKRAIQAAQGQGKAKEEHGDDKRFDIF